VQAADEGRAADDEQRVDMHLRQNMLRSHPVMDSRAASPHAEDTLHLVGPCLMLDRDSLAADVSKHEQNCCEDSHGLDQPFLAPPSV
jgi:hypothetical protein